MSWKNNPDHAGRLGLGLFVVLAILPIAFSIGYSVAYSTGLTGLLSEGFTLRHWATLFERSEIALSFGLSLYVAATTVLVSITLALLIALILGDALAHGPLSYAIYFPLAIPATVAAFFVFQMFSGAGYLTRIAINAGLVDDIADMPQLVHDPAGIGIIVAHAMLAVPFFTLLFHEIYRSENVDALAGLARTLGASAGQLLYRVKIPILLKRAAANMILYFVAVTGSYEIPLLLGRQSPQMVSVLTLRKYQLFDIQEKPEAFVIALLYTAMVLAFIGLAFRQNPEGLDG